MPLFSIITVCYNETGNIKKTLDSIIEQSFRDFELIVVDGGSTDGTKEIVHPGSSSHNSHSASAAEW